MNKAAKILTLSAVALTLGACSNIERSRNLGNPQVSGNTLAQQVCSICHGDVGSNVNGNSVNPTFPKLAGQTKEYLVEEMTEFHTKDRKDPAAQAFMWGIARNFTPKQMDELAAYYSQQPVTAYMGHSDPAQVAAGQKIFNEGVLDKGVPACMGCHGADAHGNGIIPRLAGQHADYLYKQLTVFNEDATYSDKHANASAEDLERPHEGPMPMVASGLTDAQKHAVAAYLQSLH